MRGVYLALDASTYSGSVAIVTADGSIVYESSVAMRGEQEERLMPAVAAALAKADGDELRGVVCGEGPGSFTSLRIAAAIAKGVAAARAVQLFAVPSLLLTPAAVAPRLRPGNYLSLLNAMRGEVFALHCVIDKDGLPTEAGEMRLLTDEQTAVEAARNAATTIGPVPAASVQASPHARGVAVLLAHIVNGGSVSLPDWEPQYGRLAEAEVRARGIAAAAAAAADNESRVAHAAARRG